MAEEEYTDDIAQGYRELSGIREEYFSPEMRALRDTGFDPFKDIDAGGDFIATVRGEEPKADPYAAQYRQSQQALGAPEKETEAELGGLQEPDVDPVSAAAGAAGSTYRMALSAGERLFPLLTRSVVNATTAAVTEVPIGQATAKIKERYPAMALPFSVLTGMMTGTTIEGAVEKGVMGYFAKKGVTASKQLVAEHAARIRRVLQDETGSIRIGEGDEEMLDNVRKEIGSAYDRVFNHPFGPANDPQVKIKADVLQGKIKEILIERGPVNLDEKGEVILKDSPWGMVKIIWKHGAKSAEKPGKRVAKEDLIDFPEVINKYYPAEVIENKADKRIQHVWRITRQDGEQVRYIVSQFTEADNRHRLINVYVTREKGELPDSLQIKTGGSESPAGLLRSDRDTAENAYDRVSSGQNPPVTRSMPQNGNDVNPVIEDLTPGPKPGRLIEEMGDAKAPLVIETKGIEAKAEGFLNLRPEDLPEGKAVNINFARIDSEEGVKDVLSRTAAVFGSEIDEARRGVIANDETARLANLIGMTPDKLLARRKGQAFNAEEALAARQMLIASGRRLKELSDVVAGRVPAGEGAFAGYTAQEIQFAFEKQLALHGAIQAQVSGLTAEAGRALQAFRIEAGESAGRLRQMDDILKRMQSRKIDTRGLASLISTIDTAEGLNRFARDAGKATSMDMLLEVWINSLLSGPVTHVVNSLSNTATAMLQVPERALAAVFSTILGDGAVKMGEAGAQAYGMIEGFKDGLRIFGKTILTGESQSLTGKIDLPARRAIAAKNFGIEEGTTFARAVDLLGEGVRIPTRFLQAEDDLFKSVGYRAELQARAWRTASEEGLKGEAFTRRVAEIVQDPPDDLRLAAIDQAAYQTFTQDLGETGRAGMRFLSKAPIFRFIVPFVQTPTNIIKFMGERTPLALASKEIRADIAAGGARRSMALARMSLGSMVMATTGMVAQAGNITGGGPKDPELKAALRNTGWQPYSIKVGDTYYAYNRIEPLGMLLGIAADASEIMDKVDEHEAQEIAAAAVVALAKNVTSKTWLKGISDFTQVMDDPERYFKTFLQSYAGTIVPAAAAQAERVMDPELRSTYSDQGLFYEVLNAVKARVPGWSEDLPPRRNLWGEAISREGALGPDWFSPVYTSKEKRSPVDEEMVRMDMRVRMPAETQTIMGVRIPLAAKEHDRLIVLMNKTPLPSTGRTLKASLDALVRDGVYKTASEDRKQVLIRSMIQQAKEVGIQKLWQESGDIRFLADRLQVQGMMK